MTTHHENLYHERQAQLQRMGEHWQKALWEGDPDVGWDGDRFLVVYHHVITDDILVKFEVPNQEPVLVFRVPLAEWDIKKACARLARADGRKRSAFDVIDDVDRHNNALRAAEATRKEEALADATEKVQWALRKDTGRHIAPVTVSSKPAMMAE